MTAITPIERSLLERAAAAPMRAQVEAWAALNSGSRNLAGLARMADLLAGAFSVLPGTLLLADAAPVDAIDGDGHAVPLEHGRNLHLTVRPRAPVQLLLTGHMDTVFGPDHPFRSVRETAPGTLNGPGVADMKSGLALMLAALEAMEASPLAARLGYEVVLNSDEEVGSAGSAALIARAARVPSSKAPCAVEKNAREVASPAK